MRTHKPLPADICRCHDARCPDRTNCLRWLDRDGANARVFAQSLAERGTAYCSSLIRAKGK